MEKLIDSDTVFDGGKKIIVITITNEKLIIIIASRAEWQYSHDVANNAAAARSAVVPHPPAPRLRSRRKCVQFLPV